MRITFTLFIMLLLLTACGCGDAKTRRQIIGTWFEGTNHTLTFSSDGSSTSIFKGFSDGHTDTWHGRWSIQWGRLVEIDWRSNSVVVPGDSTTKILSVDEHSLDLSVAGQSISLTR
jgi:hypothetical protein